MGMVLTLNGAGTRALEHLLAHPEDLQRFLFPELANEYASPQGPSFWQRLFGITSKKTERPPFPQWLLDEKGEELDLDKSWHGLHFLFTGSAWDGPAPENFLLRGGREVGNDLGYGPARVFQLQEVAQIHAFLKQVSDDELRARYHPAVFEKADIYPNIWQQEGMEALAYLMEYLQEMRAFVQTTVQQEQGMVVSLG